MDETVNNKREVDETVDDKREVDETVHGQSEVDEMVDDKIVDETVRYNSTKRSGI